MIPSKLQSGQKFKDSVVRTVNGIIDHLKTQKIVGDNSTIRVSQGTNGVFLSVPQNNTRTSGGKGTEFDYPFKLSIISGNYLSIQKGRVQVNDYTQNRSYALYYDDNAIPLTNLSTDNSYRAILVIQYDSTASSADENDNTFFPCNIVFTPSGINTTDFPCCQGIFSMPLGYIKKETVQGDPVFSVEQQQIIGNFNFDFQTCRYPFSITAKLNSLTDGQVKSTFSTNDFSIHVNEGAILYDKMYVSTNGDFDYNLTDSTTFIYAVLDQQTKTATLSATNSFQYFYDQQNKKCRYEIGRIYCTDGDLEIFQTAVGLQGGDGNDTYKVLSVEDEDTYPDYLSSKFVWQSSNKLDQYNKSLIGSDTVKETYSNPSATNIKLKPTWLWKDISGYQSSKYQFLTNNKSNLKWSGLSTMILLSGSLGEYVENDFDQETSRNTLKWKDEYNELSSSIKLLGEDLSGKLTTYTWNIDENIEDSVFLWNHHAPGSIHLTTPPAATKQVSSYVLAGSRSGLSWKPYPSALNLSLSGSIENIFEIVQGTSGNVLRAHTQDYIDQFQFVNLDDDGSLNYFTFTNDTNNGAQALICWNIPSAHPFTLYAPPIAENDYQILTGNKRDGFDWICLVDTISSALSGHFYKVKTVSNDNEPDYLYYKVDSLASSLLIDNETNYVNFDINPDYFYSDNESILIDEDFGLNFEINPEYFFSSDGTIAIQATSGGLDFTLSSAVVSVEEGDPPEYLNDKIDSLNQSINLTIEEDGIYEFINMDINPDYFYSSDGTVGIEATSSGIDFSLSSAVVSVEEGDQPDYLGQKILSETQSIIVDISTNGVSEALTIDINPEYFFSSDGKIGIEATSSGIDFTLSSAVVSVEEGDQPDFLAEKILSQTGSVLVDLSTNGVSEALTLDINPEYFASSDESIIVEETSSYIDFRSTGKVACTSGDTLDFLNQKINVDSSISQLITLEKQNSQILIKSALSGNGIMIINNGQISTVAIPTDGNYVLTNTSGTLGWVAYSDCDYACAEQ